MPTQQHPGEENLTTPLEGGGSGGPPPAPPVKRVRPSKLQLGLEFPPPAPLQLPPAQLLLHHQPPGAASPGSPLSPISANPSVRKRRKGTGLHDFHAMAGKQQQPPLYSECDACAPVELETAQLPNVGPTQVLDHLYIGSQADSLDADVMRRCGITHVLNVSVACPQSQHVPESNFLRIPVNDGYTDKLLPHFQRAFSFLENVRETSGRCLVHCLAGISRSPTLSIAYIMMHCKMPQDEAYRFVKQRRQHISPNFNFLGQLLEFERQLRRGEVPPADDRRPEAKRQRTSALGSPSGGPQSHLTFAGIVTRRPRSVLLAPGQLAASGVGGDLSGGVGLPVRRSRSSDAFMELQEGDDCEGDCEGGSRGPPVGPLACLS